MPQVNQYVLNNKELLELIIKQTNVHEGRWMLMATFGIAPGNYGPTLEQMTPGVAVGISNVGIQRADSNTSKKMTLDAAVVNPAPKAKASPSKRRSNLTFPSR